MIATSKKEKKKDELFQTGLMNILVTYPSGRSFTIIGRWIGPIALLDGDNPFGTEADSIAIEDGPGSVAILDPRGTYKNVDSGRTIYQPAFRKAVQP